jgi:predicted ATPase
MLNKLKIKNFGPIKEGSLENEGWIELNKVTLFIGNQGSGKSTLAKLISTLSWIEKALVRGDFSEKSLTDKVLKKHFTYQNISSYFKDETIIEYKGKAFYISFKNNAVKVRKNEINGYSFPKIMYVPSERNFVSSVRNVRTLKGLPSTLYTFSDEFINAIEELKGQIELPINKTKFEYQKLNKLSSIIGDDYKIKLSEASSGFQSFVPLYIVSDYLANSLEKKDDITTKDISIEEGKRIRKEIEQILSNPNISDDVKQASLEYLSSKFKYSSFINIVEEPEQNLFPNSQNKILNSLLKFNNLDENNSLIITTHSPYILNYLCVSIQANYIFEKLMNFSNQKPALFLSKLHQIVPHKSMVSSSNVVIYELDEITGTIKRLKDYEGIPSDNNYLNKSLEEANKMFDSLFEIEQQL